MIKCCAPDCPKRKQGCHATCPEYKEQRAAHESDREERRKKEAEISAIKAVAWNGWKVNRGK